MSTTAALTAGNIVVGVDGSPSSHEAVVWAAEQAELDHRCLTLLHAYHLENAAWVAQAGLDQNLILDSLEESGATLLARARVTVRALSPDVEVEETLVRGDARDALALASRTASLVVVGSRGHGRLAGLLLGSVGFSLVQHSSCPVVVRRSAGEGTRHGVLVGTDGTDDTFPALEHAFRLAASRCQPVSVLTFGPDFPWFGDRDGSVDPLTRDRIDRWLAALGEKCEDVAVSVQHVTDPQARALVERAGQMDVVVVGSHHEGFAAAALGRALAIAVVEHACSTVVVVPDAPNA
jgi:nucleotide-binding universal stress UspA family protein